MLRRVPSALAVVAAAVSVTIVGCTNDRASEPDDTATTQTLPVPSVAAPPERLTPFCQAMIELSDRLERDPPDDVRALIVETYEQVAGDVPIEIADEFAVVLDALRTGQPVPTAPGGTSGETTAPPIASDAAAETTDPAGVSVPTERERAVEEEILPEDPTLRVNQYIDFTCRGNANNPGPPATQPLAGVTPDTVEE